MGWEGKGWDGKEREEERVGNGWEEGREGKGRGKERKGWDGVLQKFLKSV
jgi:hypothetical protein